MNTLELVNAKPNWEIGGLSIRDTTPIGERGMKEGKIGDMEYECANCKVRLDPLMTEEEAEYFLKNGCIVCHHVAWRLVPPTYGDEGNEP